MIIILLIEGWKCQQNNMTTSQVCSMCLLNPICVSSPLQIGWLFQSTACNLKPKDEHLRYQNTDFTSLWFRVSPRPEPRPFWRPAPPALAFLPAPEAWVHRSQATESNKAPAYTLEKAVSSVLNPPKSSTSFIRAKQGIQESLKFSHCF